MEAIYFWSGNRSNFPISDNLSKRRGTQESHVRLYDTKMKVTIVNPQEHNGAQGTVAIKKLTFGGPYIEIYDKDIHKNGTATPRFQIVLYTSS